MQYVMKYKYYTKTIPLPNGKRKYIRGKTKEELERKLEEARRELSYGIDISDQTKVKDYAEYWFHTIKEPNVSENTAQQLHARLENHVYPYIGAMMVRDVRPASIRMVMQKCSHFGRGTQEKVLSALRNIFALAADEDNLILRSPVPSTLKPQGESSKETEPLTPEQEQELLRVTEGTSVGYMVRLLLGTGLRRGEMTGLMWSDIDWDERVLYVRRHVVTDVKGTPHIEDGAKTAAGVRTVPLTDGMVAMLREMYGKSHSLYVFTTRNGRIYSSTAVTHLWSSMTKKLSFYCHPHQLRHTYVTKLFEAGLDIKEIQYLVGHADPSITLQTYTHYRETARAKSTLNKARIAVSV